MTSLFEGLCYAALEASSMGIPVVATKVGGLRSSVAHGQTGILVESRDPVALSKAIMDLICDQEKAESLGRQGRERICKLFTNEKMFSEFENLFLNFEHEMSHE
jgi:glycosyltransferase involved in cell wall biosynthesis